MCPVVICVAVCSEDSVEDLEEKVRLATVLGTFQASLVDFKYLGPEWSQNTVEERLLGVSLTGIMDNPMMANQRAGCAHYPPRPRPCGGGKLVCVQHRTGVEGGDVPIRLWYASHCVYVGTRP